MQWSKHHSQQEKICACLDQSEQVEDSPIHFYSSAEWIMWAGLQRYIRNVHWISMPPVNHRKETWPEHTRGMHLGEQRKGTLLEVTHYSTHIILHAHPSQVATLHPLKTAVWCTGARSVIKRYARGPALPSKYYDFLNHNIWLLSSWSAKISTQPVDSDPICPFMCIICALSYFTIQQHHALISCSTQHCRNSSHSWSSM